MSYVKKLGIINCFISLLLALASPVIAQAQTEILLDADTPLKDKEISAGSVKVKVNYKPFDFNQEQTSETDNLTYQIFHDGIPKVNASDVTILSGSVSLKDLDSNGVAEVIVSTYSGGAHCCTNLTIYTWKNNQFLQADIEGMNSGGGIFQDLNGDGKFEFLSSDDAFLYQFSAYASSFPPSRIYLLKEGKLENVTRKYPKELKTRAWEMYQAFLKGKQEEYEVNGILAGYVAQKILLGEYQQGWNFMLANYDRTSDWGLEIYQGDRQVGKYPDFPTALKAFLIQQGYLDKNGRPFP
ncbi:MAG: FG-GAP repeat domain-containing protein [Microcystaceae cyanobacterium]